MARDLAGGGAKDIFGKEGKYDICPNSLEKYHSVENVSRFPFLVLVWGSAANCCRFASKTTKSCRG